MASVIYPYGTDDDETPYQVEKVLRYYVKNIKPAHPNGYIIAKGNIIEGIKAKE